MSYTPGPWTVGDEYEETYGPPILADGVVVASVLDHGPDASLIAAAPDLLRELEFHAPRLHSARHGNIHSPDDFSYETCADCAGPRAAIAKAHGESKEAAPPK